MNEPRIRRKPRSVPDRAQLEAAGHRQRLDSAVDILVGEWVRAVPEADADVRAIAARIARVNDRLRAGTNDLLARHGLSDNEFRLLAGLVRSGEPYRCAPSDLAGRYVPVTSGGLTGLANKLEQRGLIRRVMHPSDQRSVLIELTEPGRALAFTAMSGVAALEGALMAGLSQAERNQTNRLLRKLLHSIEAALA